MSDKKIKQLEEELEKAKSQAQEYLDGWKRVKADYINREREIEKDKSMWMEFINLDFLLKLLPILETFEQAFQHKDKGEEFIKGLEQIYKQFENLLKGFGLERIKTIGERFDPKFHEAVEKRGEEEIVTEEISPGYKINGKVVKVAKVVIK